MWVFVVASVLFTVENTDPNVAWLPNYLEVSDQWWGHLLVACRELQTRSDSFQIKAVYRSRKFCVHSFTTFGPC